MTFTESIDPYFFREYNADTYHCGHFTAEVWQDMTGIDIRPILGVLLGPLAGRKLKRGQRAAFRRLTQPVSPCLAYMDGPKMLPHIGVYFEGAILHLRPNGVEWLDPELAMRGFKTVIYYTCKE